MTQTKSSSRHIPVPELCLPPRRQERFASGTHDPEKWRPVFGQDHAHKREAERRKAHANHVRAIANKCTQFAPLVCCAAARIFLKRRARLSAPTLAALANGFYPDGSAPEPGFPKSQACWVFCPLASSLRLSTLRADRSLCRSTGDPGPPECGLAIPPAGTAPRSASLACLSGKAPSVSELNLK
jgi:hypothetical protein